MTTPMKRLAADAGAASDVLRNLPNLEAEEAAALEAQLSRQIHHVELCLKEVKGLLRAIRRHRQLAHESAPKRETGFVYAMFDDRTMLVKIGYASDPEKRRRTIQTATGGTLHFIGLIGAEQPEEYRLHRLFAPDRVKGEWFRVSENLIAHFETNTDPVDAATCEPQYVRRLVADKILRRSA